ncbi:MAG: NAD(P)-binding domain-containing protein [Micrococcaceae bacterium]
MPKDFYNLPIVVIGAGPIGLATAAYLQNYSLDFIVLEKCTTIAASIEKWRHVSLFSVWKRNVDALALQLLEKYGHHIPDMEACPTGAEFIEEYLKPLALTPELAPHIKLNVEVLAVARADVDKLKASMKQTPFVVRAKTAQGMQDIYARGVIDASGTWDNPSPLGASGIPALGEEQLSEHLAGTLPDVLGAQRERFANQRALVVGNGYSAANSILALSDLAEQESDTKIFWTVRGESVKHFYSKSHLSKKAARWLIGERLQNLLENSKALELIPQFSLKAFEQQNRGVRVIGSTPEGSKSLDVDVVINGTGFRPNLQMHREILTDFDIATETPARLVPFMEETAKHPVEVTFDGASALAHPQQDFYVIGMKSYGRKPGFFLFFGYEQAKVVAAAFAGDEKAAGPVVLQLPWNVEKY